MRAAMSLDENKSRESENKWALSVELQTHSVIATL